MLEIARAASYSGRNDRFRKGTLVSTVGDGCLAGTTTAQGDAAADKNTSVKSSNYSMRMRGECIGQLLDRYNLIRPHKNCSLSKEAVQSAIKRIAQRAGLKRVSPHTLRRTFATHLHDHGASIEVIQALMGHVWIQTTTKYIRISTDRLVNTVEQFHPGAQIDAQTSP